MLEVVKEKSRNYCLGILIVITLIYVASKKPKSKNDLKFKIKLIAMEIFLSSISNRRIISIDIRQTTIVYTLKKELKELSMKFHHSPKFEDLGRPAALLLAYNREIWRTLIRVHYKVAEDVKLH